MLSHGVVVIGASAGGFDVVRTIVQGLPSDLPLAVFAVIHTSPGSRGGLPLLLSRRTGLRVYTPAGRNLIEPGCLYVAPADRHLVISDHRVVTSRGPQENGFRPAIDPLFVSAARSFGECVIGVIVSGMLDDGTAGLLAIKKAGGLAIVQDPEEATFPSMPLSALRNVKVDAVLPAAEIASRIVEMAKGDGTRASRWRNAGRRPSSKEAVPGRGASTVGRRSMSGDMKKTAPPGGQLPGPRTLVPLTCPNCGGALWEIDDEGLTQYECHLGHRFGKDSLLAIQSERLEDTLWAAARALKEHAALHRRMADRASRRQMSSLSAEWSRRADESETRAEELRGLIESMGAQGPASEKRTRQPGKRRGKRRTGKPGARNGRGR